MYDVRVSCTCRVWLSNPFEVDFQESIMAGHYEGRKRTRREQEQIDARIRLYTEQLEQCTVDLDAPAGDEQVFQYVDRVTDI